MIRSYRLPSLLLLLLALVPGVCPTARAGDSEEAEYAKLVQLVGNEDVESTCVEAYVQLGGVLAGLDRQFREAYPDASAWREQASGLRTYLDEHLVFAYSAIEEVEDETARKEQKERVDKWRSEMANFFSAKITTAGGAAMDLSESLAQRTEYLTGHKEKWARIVNDFVAEARRFPPHHRQLLRDIADYGEMKPGLKTMEVRSKLRERVGYLVTAANNLGGAVQGRVGDVKEFLAKADPQDTDEVFFALRDKAYAASELAGLSQIPESWRTMLTEWVAVVATRRRDCLEACSGAFVAHQALVDGKIFDGVPLFQGLAYVDLANPIRALTNDL